MKTLVAVASLLVLVSCETSVRQAPYPPRGWRPNGPAFELPTEIERKNSIEEIITTEVKAENSGFEEYGAPAAAYQEKDQENYITVQQLPADIPSQFYKQLEETEFRSRLIEDIEAETDDQNSLTIEPEFKTTTPIEESEFVNISTEGYTKEQSTFFSEESLSSTTEIGNVETISYNAIQVLDEEEPVQSDEKLLDLSAQNLKLTLVGKEELSTVESTELLLKQNIEVEDSETVTELEDISTTNGVEETTTLADELQVVDATTESYIQTTALAEDEEFIDIINEFGNVEKTTFSPIVVLNLEEQSRNKEEDLETSRKSNISEEVLSQSLNGTFKGAAIQKEESSSVLSVEKKLTQIISSSIQTFEEKYAALQRQHQEVGSSGTSGSVLKTNNLAELRNLDYTPPVGFAEYGVPFEQYGTPQSGARRLEVDLTTGYELDSSTTKIVPAEPLTPVLNTSPDLPRDGRKRRFSPKIRNINAVFRFNGKGPENVNVH